jgi:hypothetical protein
MASPIWTAYPGLQVQVQDVGLVNQQYWIYWPKKLMTGRCIRTRHRTSAVSLSPDTIIQATSKKELYPPYYHPQIRSTCMRL